MQKRKYKKPLSETKHVDNWKCPWCREIITTEPKAMQYSNFDIHDGEFEEVCPECGKKSSIFLSVMYMAQPVEDEDEE